MAEASRRAARSAGHGGQPNALFVVAAAERLPRELLGVADELSIHFPWGSLLRGALAVDGAAANGIVSILRPGACAIVTVSITPRDGLAVASLDAPGAAHDLAHRWACLGLQVASVAPATLEEVRATASTWGKRLAAGRQRPAWRFTLRRVDGGAAASQDAPPIGR
jgi:16S rRNA (adenine(1408)-N(1))-methyltransferase